MIIQTLAVGAICFLIYKSLCAHNQLQDSKVKIMARRNAKGEVTYGANCKRRDDAIRAYNKGEARIMFAGVVVAVISIAVVIILQR